MELPRTGASRRIPELDGIRGLAILLVLVWHYFACQVQPQPGSLLADVVKATSFTWSGVDLFFVLSGFLIGGLLLENRTAVNYFGVFYARRICRIFPLYFAWLIVFAAALWAWPQLRVVPPFDWLFGQAVPLWSYATFTQNVTMAGVGAFGANFVGVTWSLAVEEQFYLVLPFIVRWGRSLKFLLVLLVALIVCAPAIRMAFYYQHHSAGFAGYVLLPCRMDALLLGVLSAWAVRTPGPSQYLRRHVPALYALLGILLAFVAFLLVTNRTIGTKTMTSVGYTALALLYTSVLLIALMERRGVVSAIVRTSVLRKLGTIAYGVYIFHQGISGLCHALILGQVPQMRTPADLGVTLLALALTILIATFSWRAFEARLVAVGHRWKYTPAHAPSLLMASSTGVPARQSTSS